VFQQRRDRQWSEDYYIKSLDRYGLPWEDQDDRRLVILCIYVPFACIDPWINSPGRKYAEAKQRVNNVHDVYPADFESQEPARADPGDSILLTD
jgi:hypothetical protein